MTHLERKMNRKQIEKCKEAFRQALHNDGDKEDMKQFRQQWREYKESCWIEGYSCGECDFKDECKQNKHTKSGHFKNWSYQGACGHYKKED